MKDNSFQIPDHIYTDPFGLYINLSNPVGNIIKINRTDYIPYYLDNSKPGNKGSNIIIKLIEAQNSDEDNIYPSVPNLILKICRTPILSFEDAKSKRFANEIKALRDCFTLDQTNTIRLYHQGVVTIYDSVKKRDQKHRFYTMEYASDDLASYLKNNNPSLLDRLNLILEICSSLRLLWRSGYYHRDIKPDNILFCNTKWKIGDLGLVDHRDTKYGVDKLAEWIGPRGWQSPEALNKFLTEGRPWSSKFDCKINHQSDLYQLGKLIWYVIQGNSPEGIFRREDFLFEDDRLYNIIINLLKHTKEQRTKSIDELIESIKLLFEIYYKEEPTFSLH